MDLADVSWYLQDVVSRSSFVVSLSCFVVVCCLLFQVLSVDDTHFFGQMKKMSTTMKKYPNGTADRIIKPRVEEVSHLLLTIP